MTREQLKAIQERHVVETPERHVKYGTEDSPDDPHCNACWEKWPCDAGALLQELNRLQEAGRLFQVEVSEVMFSLVTRENSWDEWHPASGVDLVERFDRLLGARERFSAALQDSQPTGEHLASNPGYTEVSGWGDDPRPSDVTATAPGNDSGDGTGEASPVSPAAERPLPSSGEGS